ncbi:MAG TPA: hypothetical protein VGK99_23375 [Acidobacteriota bacterium]|jgi:hypothetical protein
MSFRRELIVALCVFAFLTTLGSASFPNDYDVYFPQVAKGIFGNRLETVIVISNPNQDTAEVTLSSVGIDLPQPTIFTLGPKSTRQVLLSGGNPQVGFVHLNSNVPLSAVAHILVRSLVDPGQLLSSVATLPQPRTSKALIPVFVKSQTADDTGIAIAYRQEGFLKFTLYDTEGTEIVSRTERMGFDLQSPFSFHASMFVTELFPNLPPDFKSGSLVIEHVNPLHIAHAFAVTALYVRGASVISAPVSSVDDPRFYLLFLKTTIDVQDQVKQLADQYGFTVTVVRNDFSSVLMTFEVARAVARDPRVKAVLVNNAVVGT